MKRQTDVIFFDAGGTLFRPYPSVGAVYAQVAAKHGVIVEADVVEKAFHKHWHTRNGLSTLAGLTSEKIERDWWYALVRDVFGNLGEFNDFDGFFQELYDLFARAECWKLFDDTIPTLEKIREKGFRMGIISNWDHRLFSIVEQLGLADFFEQVTASSKVGIAKPGKGIFEAALKAMNIDAAHGLHIGDSLEDDYHGATRAGMKAVLLDRQRKYVEPSPGLRPPSPGKGEGTSKRAPSSIAGEGTFNRTPSPFSGEGRGEGYKGVAGEAIQSKKSYNDVVAVHTLGDLIPLINGYHYTHNAQS